MPGAKNNAVAEAIARLCSEKYQDRSVSEKRNGFFSYESGAACTAKKAKDTPSERGGQAIKKSCFALYEPEKQKYVPFSGSLDTQNKTTRDSAKAINATNATNNAAPPVSTENKSHEQFYRCVLRNGAVEYTPTEMTGAGVTCVDLYKRASNDSVERPKPVKSRTLEGLAAKPPSEDGSFSPSCPSTTTIKINSSTYSGSLTIELRSGTRPGSQQVSRKSIYTNGEATFRNICPGTYFYAFAPDDSDDVSTTRYFNVENSNGRYTNPAITVFYTRTLSSGAQRVGSSKRKDL